jgi:hypothetical protein
MVFKHECQLRARVSGQEKSPPKWSLDETPSRVSSTPAISGRIGFGWLFVEQACGLFAADGNSDFVFVDDFSGGEFSSVEFFALFARGAGGIRVQSSSKATWIFMKAALFFCPELDHDRRPSEGRRTKRAWADGKESRQERALAVHDQLCAPFVTWHSFKGPLESVEQTPK